MKTIRLPGLNIIPIKILTTNHHIYLQTAYLVNNLSFTNWVFPELLKTFDFILVSKKGENYTITATDQYFSFQT